VNDNALVSLEGVAAALMAPDINTDIIAPLVRGGPGGAQPAGIRSQEELAQRLFGPWRYLEDGRENPEFILNREPWRQARFLVAGPNFACGSSRETAATMLKAFGVRCVVAPGFGQIFHDNCYRNHMLPLVMDEALVEKLALSAAGGADFALDMEALTITPPEGEPIAFALPSFRREMLLQGTDEIQFASARSAEIAAWQASAQASRPWEWPRSA
jgi:3-isopropylmalate/(R)-2-methylmalate dehydratase small subunit